MTTERRSSTHGHHRKHGASRVEATQNVDITPSTRQRAFSCVKNKSESSEDGISIRPRTCSMPTGGNFNSSFVSNLRNRGQTSSIPDHESDTYTVRMFEVSSKGVIKKRSDSWRSRSTASFSSEGEPCPLSQSSAASSSSQDSIGNCAGVTPASVVLVLGADGVGKTALTQQFMTSEYLGGFDTSSGKLTYCYRSGRYVF